MALYAHPFEPAVELVEFGRNGQSCGAGFFPVADDQVQHEFFFPFDEGIAQQRHQVVGNRAVQGILEIKHARPAGRQHQVADDVVAVDEHLRLRQERR